MWLDYEILKFEYESGNDIIIYTYTISLLCKTCLMHCTAVKLILCLQANSSSGYCPISLVCPISLLDLISSPYHLEYFYYMLNMPSTLAESGHVFISWFKLRSSTVDRNFRADIMPWWSRFVCSFLNLLCHLL